MHNYQNKGYCFLTHAFVLVCLQPTRQTGKWFSANRAIVLWQYLHTKTDVLHRVGILKYLKSLHLWRQVSSFFFCNEVLTRKQWFNYQWYWFNAYQNLELQYRSMTWLFTCTWMILAESIAEIHVRGSVVILNFSFIS